MIFHSQDPKKGRKIPDDIVAYWVRWHKEWLEQLEIFISFCIVGCLYLGPLV
jgi:hypothetical protein